MPDRDGYPTEEELSRIREWPHTDLHGWFTFIKSCWWATDWGWIEGEEHRRRIGETPGEQVYRISTGGWSGNESIIRAMQQNLWLWSITWYETRRGGHVTFTLREGK